MDPKVANAKDLPTDIIGAPDGLYAIKSTQPLTLEAEDSCILTEIWFKTPPLEQKTIDRIKTIQLYAESRDQGYADNPLAGNWTWFEFVILDSPSTDVPRTVGGVNLVWRSHYNRFLSNEYGWAEGEQYGKSLIGLLKPGNVIAVRLSARFQGWTIMAKEGVLIIELGKPTNKISLGVSQATNFKEVIGNVEAIQDIFKEANDELNAAYDSEIPESVYRADSFLSATERPIRVLSLDGGGVRGLSSLYLLKEVMKIVSPDGKLKPCDIFDIIGGTSTGGLIAIMLGRLRMDVDTCIQKYTDFVGKIFNLNKIQKIWNLKKTGSYYDATKLEDLIKDIVAEALHDANAPLLQDDVSCRVFVTSFRLDAANNRAPIILRSYKNENKLPVLPNIKVWESARATSAAPAYFAPIQVDKYKLVDGGLGANNPLGWLWNEVLDVFGPARRTACFLSIGTGIPKNVPIARANLVYNNELVKSLSAVATNAQLTHALFKGLLNAYVPTPRIAKYWRLNVGVEIPGDDYQDLGDLDDVGKLKVLLEITQDYIKAQTTLIKNCADALRESLS